MVYDDEGLRIHSSDGRRQLRIAGVLAAGALFVDGDTNASILSSFEIRRARVYFDANLNPWIAFRLLLSPVPAAAPPLAAAFVDLSFSRNWWLRVGKTKVPFGAERALAIEQQPFAERSIASHLTPDREHGAMLTGEFGGGRAEGSLGVFNGVPDGATGEGDVSDAKDVALRFIVRPLVRTGERGLTLGYNGTASLERRVGANPPLPKFGSPAARTFFSYREIDSATGARTRNGLFSYAHFGQWGATAEWFRNVQRLRSGDTQADISTGGWLALTEYVFTGEPSVHGGATPSKPFDPVHGSWGVFEVVARAARVHVGREAFPLFADSAVAAREATETAVGLNWFFTKNTKAQLNFERTSYRGGKVVGDRRTEEMILLRLQAQF